MTLLFVGSARAETAWLWETKPQQSCRALLSDSRAWNRIWLQKGTSLCLPPTGSQRMVQLSCRVAPDITSSQPQWGTQQGMLHPCHPSLPKAGMLWLSPRPTLMVISHGFCGVWNVCAGFPGFPAHPEPCLWRRSSLQARENTPVSFVADVGPTHSIKPAKTKMPPPHTICFRV